jgi:hypothetical protein
MTIQDRTKPYEWKGVTKESFNKMSFLEKLKVQFAYTDSQCSQKQHRLIRIKRKFLYSIKYFIKYFILKKKLK